MLERFLYPKKIEVLSSLELNGIWILFPLIGFLKNPGNMTNHIHIHFPGVRRVSVFF